MGKTKQIDWSQVFDESRPKRGAKPAALQQLAASVTAPLTGAEIKEINKSQRNPFPKSDPFYKQYRPFDPRAWKIPSGELPPAYLDFLAWSNGGEFLIGKRLLQMFPHDDLRGMLLAYHLPQYMPLALPFAFNGGGTFYAFDMREPLSKGEYPIVAVAAGNLSWDTDACAKVAPTFEKACRARRMSMI